MEDVLEWFESVYFNHSETFSYEELKPIMGFPLLWNLFESELCSRNANYDCLNSISNRFSTNLSNDTIAECVEYFKDRYVQNGVLNSLFSSVNVPQNKMDIINDVFIEDTTEKTRKIEALLIIAYRFRNNFFHGEKELRNLNSQRNNFMLLNKFISSIIEIKKEV